MVVFGLEVDAGRMAVKRLATIAFGNVLAVVNLEPQDLLIAQGANFARPNSLASTHLPAIGAGHLSRRTADLYREFGCFLASMPVSLLLVSSENPISEEQAFLTLDQLKTGGVHREVSKNESVNCPQEAAKWSGLGA